MLKDLVVVVTGVTSGLGRGIATVFTGMGARVIGSGRRLQHGRALEEALAASGRFTFLAADVAKAGDCRQTIEACLARHGRVDVLINNAAITGAPDVTRVEALAEETWDQVLAINLRGAFLMARAAIPAMKSQGDGVILNIASMNARIGIEGLAAYNASKAGLVQLSRTLAVEGLPFGIRSNAIILGGVATEGGTDTALALGLQGRTDRPSLRQSDAAHASGLMAPEDVAEALASLCLRQARLITGSEIAIDRAVTAGSMVSAMIKASTAQLYA